MKYIKKFEKEADRDTWRASDEFVSPNVALTVDSGQVSYNVPKLQGVFIQHIDGALYTEEEWTAAGFTNEEANGVAVITDNARFVIAKSNLGTMAWSSNTSSLVDGIMTATDAATAKTDFAGYNNTQLMLATDTSKAGYSCANFIFPNGDKGYLPALGELNEAYVNKSKINSLMIKIGGAVLLSDNYWSSTQCDSSSSWRIFLNDGRLFNSQKYNSGFYVRAFSALTL